MTHPERDPQSIHSYREDIGARCKTLRGEQGLSVWKMAQRAKLSINAVKRLENGDGITINTLLAYLSTIDEAIEITDQSKQPFFKSTAPQKRNSAKCSPL